MALSLILLLEGALPAFAAAQPFPPPAATPQEALRLAVESWGERYAGICEAARSPEDVGKVCSRFVAEQGGVRAYLIGRTFSGTPRGFSSGPWEDSGNLTARRRWRLRPP